MYATRPVKMSKPGYTQEEKNILITSPAIMTVRPRRSWVTHSPVVSRFTDLNPIKVKCLGHKIA